jgi:hypothetical protein
LQYTIEARELSSAHSSAWTSQPGPQPGLIVANDPQDAIEQYVRDLHAVLLTFMQPSPGRESIGIVKKEDMVLLVRVYAA